MKLKKLLLSLSLAIGLVGIISAQVIPDQVRIDVVRRGKFLPWGELADGWDVVWDKINDDLIMLDTMLHTVQYDTRFNSVIFIPQTSTPTLSEGEVFYQSATDLLLLWNGSDYDTLNTTGGAVGGVSTDSSWLSIEVNTINEYNPSGGVTIDGVLLRDGNIRLTPTNRLYLDGGSDTYIHEYSSDNVRFVVGGSNLMSFVESGVNSYVQVNNSFAAINGVYVNSIVEYSGDNGVYVDNLLIKDSGIPTLKADTIYEYNSGEGVGIEDVLLKDGEVVLEHNNILRWDDGSSSGYPYIKGYVSDAVSPYLQFSINGSGTYEMRMYDDRVVINSDIRPAVGGQSDLGSDVYQWKNLWLDDTLALKSSSGAWAYIYNAAATDYLTFSDPTGSYTLAELAGGTSIDHGSLSGLSGDDHTQYLNTSRANTWFATKSHTLLTDIGDSTHAAIDDHLESTSNPHGVTSTQVLPDQTGNNGKYLTTNGTVVSWAAVSGGGGGDSTTMSVDTIKRYTAGHGLWLEDEGLWIKDTTIVDTTARGVNVIDFDYYDALLLGSYSDYTNKRGGWIELDTLYASMGHRRYDGLSDWINFSDDGVYFTFQNNTAKGVEIWEDLSTLSPGDSSLVWKKYVVDAIAAGAGADSTFVSLTTGTINEYTGGNGVTIDGLVLKDGGLELATDFNVTGSETYAVNFGVAGDSITDFIVRTDDDIGLYAFNSLIAQVPVGASNSAQFGMTSSNYLIFANGGATFYDQISSGGLKYNADYSANYTSRSLVDSAFVGAAIVSASLGDTVSIDTVAHMLIDTLQIPLNVGLNNAKDTAAFSVDAIFMEFSTVQDSVVFDSVKVYVTGNNGNIGVTFYWLDDENDSSPTAICSEISPSVSGGADGTSTFTVPAVGPGKLIRGVFTSVNIQPHRMGGHLYYHEKRAY